MKKNLIAVGCLIILAAISTVRDWLYFPKDEELETMVKDRFEENFEGEFTVEAICKEPFAENSMGKLTKRSGCTCLIQEQSQPFYVYEGYFSYDFEDEIAKYNSTYVFDEYNMFLDSVVWSKKIEKQVNDELESEFMIWIELYGAKNAQSNADEIIPYNRLYVNVVYELKTDDLLIDERKIAAVSNKIKETIQTADQVSYPIYFLIVKDKSEITDTVKIENTRSQMLVEGYKEEYENKNYIDYRMIFVSSNEEGEKTE